MPTSDEPEVLLRRFAAGLAHDLNNALTAVIGLSELMASNDALDPSLREPLRLVTAHARRIAALARRLSAFSREEFGLQDAAARIEAVLAQPVADVTVQSPAVEVPASRSGNSVLLVDDEEVVRTVVAWQLEGMGYRVLTAPSGEEALELHARQPERIAAALLDMILPGINGLEVCRRLRQDDPDLPIIMLSGLQRDSSAANDVLWLVKPVALGDLQDALTSVLHRA